MPQNETTVEVLSRKDAARIRGVSERTIDRLCETPDSGVRKVKLSARRVGIIGARDLAESRIKLSDQSFRLIVG